jgi:hypothetical protein
MAHIGGYAFPVPEAARLADLYGVAHDLRTVLSYCNRIETLSTESLDLSLWDLFCSAAVVRYARCFSSGVRQSLEHDIFATAEQDKQELHTYVMAVRNKHIAHSVNAFENNVVTVMIRESEDGTEIFGVGASQGRVLGLSLDKPKRLSALAEWVLAKVEEAIEEEKARVLEMARTFGPEKILSFGLPTSGKGIGTDPSRSRPR